MADIDMAFVGYSILPIGFPSFEKAKIDSFFHLAQQRAPHWALTDTADQAQVILFNTNNETDIANFLSLVKPWQKAILVGKSDFGTGWPVIQRPLKLTQILHALDAIKVGNKTSVVQAPIHVVNHLNHNDTKLKSDSLEGITIIGAPRVVDIPLDFTAKNVANKITSAPVVTTSIPKLVNQYSSKNHSQSMSAPNVIALSAAPSFTIKNTLPASEVTQEVSHPLTLNSTSTLGKVLLVDDSDIALNYMQKLLSQFGYSSELASSGDDALAMLAQHNYHFVFLDVMMPGLDGYKTCKAIKTNKAINAEPPVVVMLTSRGGMIDKIRGSMAGCDAYLTKPLNQSQLAVVIGKFDKSTATQRWEAVNPTAPLENNYVELK